MKMKLRALPETPPEPSEGFHRRRIPRWDRCPDPELAAAVGARAEAEQDPDSADLSASPMQTAVALSVLHIGAAIALLEFAPHHARGSSLAAGRGRLRAFLAANGLERLDARRDDLIDRALTERIPTESLLRLGASDPVEDHDEDFWLEAARIWGVPNLTAVTTPDDKSFPFWEAALRGEFRAADLITVQSSSMGIRRQIAYEAYRGLCALKSGTLPYSAVTLKRLIMVAADADEFRLCEEMVTEYGAPAAEGGRAAASTYPQARGRTSAEFEAVVAYAKPLTALVTRDEWGLVVALHDAGFPAEDLIWRLHGGEMIRSVAAEVLDGVQKPLTDGWL